MPSTRRVQQLMRLDKAAVVVSYEKRPSAAEGSQSRVADVARSYEFITVRPAIGAVGWGLLRARRVGWGSPRASSMQRPLLSFGEICGVAPDRGWRATSTWSCTTSASEADCRRLDLLRVQQRWHRRDVAECLHEAWSPTSLEHVTSNTKNAEANRYMSFRVF